MSKEIDFNEVFNDSYKYVLNNNETFYKKFYEIFLDSDPRINKTFMAISIEKQIHMLNDAVCNLVHFFVTKVADQHLIDTARHHSQSIKIGNDMYGLFLSSLIKTLECEYPRYTNNCAIAWRITLAPGIEFMKYYSDRDENV
jgi:hemoglobin-like flavoprotein